MTAKMIFTISARGFIFLSAFSLVYVAILAIINPQSVMDLVQVKLTNTDALSSIRGVYGGVGVTLFITLVYLGIYHIEKGLAFLSLFWGSYSLSRIITILVDGALGSFGTNWLWIETIFCLIGISLILFGRRFNRE
jgi:hypothetical protein